MFKYDHYIADYLADTCHLSRDQDLAYRRLMEVYYLGEQPLSKSLPNLARRIRFDPENEVDVQSVKLVLEEFFVEMDDGWHQNRADEEINKATRIHKNAIKNGKLGGGKQRLSKCSPNSMSGASKGYSKRLLARVRSPSPSPSLKENYIKEKKEVPVDNSVQVATGAEDHFFKASGKKPNTGEMAGLVAQVLKKVQT